MGGQAETGGGTDGTNRVNAFTNIDSRVTDLTALTQVMAHELDILLAWPIALTVLLKLQ